MGLALSFLSVMVPAPRSIAAEVAVGGIWKTVKSPSFALSTFEAFSAQANCGSEGHSWAIATLSDAANFTGVS